MRKLKQLLKLTCCSFAIAALTSIAMPAAKTEAATPDMYETETNDTPAAANLIPVNAWVRGSCVTTDKNDKEDWYKVVIPNVGATQLEIQQTEDNTLNRHITVELQDESRHSLRKFSGLNTKDIMTGFAPGTYYVRVTSLNGFSTSYLLRVNHTASADWESDRYYEDKNFANANLLPVGVIRTGSMYTYGDIEYYRIPLQGNNTVELSFTIDPSVADPGMWTFYIYDSNYNELLKSGQTTQTNRTWTVECVGDCLIKIRDLASGRTTGDIYHLKATVKPAVKPDVVTTSLDTPKISSAKPGKKKAAIKWGKVKNASMYYVYRSTKKNSGYKLVATVNGKTSYTDKNGLERKKKYYYKVTAIGMVNGKNILSAFSSAMSVKTK